MKHKKKYENKIIEKSKNTTPIRVLYKKTGQAPETKIIDNVFKKENLRLFPMKNFILSVTTEKQYLTQNQILF